MNNLPPNLQPNQQNQNENPSQDQNENPHEEEKEPPPVERPPLVTQDNIMNEIERGKN